MIERCAIALAADSYPDKAWEDYSDHEREDYRGHVLAVLGAMRGPIVEALKPFADCAEELDGSEYTPRTPEGEWAKFRLLTDDYRRARDAVAMIDAALK